MSTITPELALVDPELAVAARALLHEPGQFRPRSEPRAASGTADRVIETPRRTRPVAVRGRRLAGSPALVSAATVAAAALLLAAAMWRPGETRTPAHVAGPQLHLRALASAQSRAARSYMWPAVPGAEVYKIQIVRNGQLVYEATTRKPALRFPAELALSPGTYTLSATPQSNGSSPDPAARPVVEETFQVSS